MTVMLDTLAAALSGKPAPEAARRWARAIRNGRSPWPRQLLKWKTLAELTDRAPWLDKPTPFEREQQDAVDVAWAKREAAILSGRFRDPVTREVDEAALDDFAPWPYVPPKPSRAQRTRAIARRALGIAA